MRSISPVIYFEFIGGEELPQEMPGIYSNSASLFVRRCQYLFVRIDHEHCQ